MGREAHSRPTDVDIRFRQLAHRSSHGVDVTLSWHTDTDELLVASTTSARMRISSSDRGTTLRSTPITTRTRTSHAARVSPPRRVASAASPRDGDRGPEPVRPQARLGAHEENLVSPCSVAFVRCLCSRGVSR